VISTNLTFYISDNYDIFVDILENSGEAMRHGNSARSGELGILFYKEK
jgi:hypothetical protein